MGIAFCIKCGTQKKSPFTVCKSCGFKPTKTAEKAKSLWLSSDRKQTLEDIELNAEPAPEQLKEFASLLSRGQSVKFPSNEIKMLIEQHDYIQEFKTWKAMLFGACFLILPVIAILLLVFG